TAGGIGVVAAIVELSSWGIYAAHWISLGASIAIALVWATAVLAARRRRSGAGPAAEGRTRAGLLVYGVAPYFLYGLVYFALLFADRLIAWSAGHHPLPIWFRSPYEVGL